MALLLTAPLQYRVTAIVVLTFTFSALYTLGGYAGDQQPFTDVGTSLGFGAALAVIVAACYAAILYAAHAAAIVYRNGRNLFRTVHVTDRHGGQLVVEVLKAHGVRFVFTLIGGHISPIVVASAAAGLRVIDVRHEVTAVFAADAVARLTGVPGVAMVTAGPGLTNTLTAVKNASMAESPLVLIAGAAATLTAGRGALQDIDQLSLMRSVCKDVISVARVRDIVPALRAAFATAASGVPGPVFVELPIDVLYPVQEVQANLNLVARMRVRDVAVIGDRGIVGGLKSDEAAQALLQRIILPEEAGGDVSAYLRSRGRPDAPIFLRLEPGKKGPGAIVEHYLKSCVRDLFGDGFTALTRAKETGDFSAFAPLALSIPRPTPSRVTAAATLLRTSSRPVLLVASQAMLFDPLQRCGGVRQPSALVQALDALGVPVYAGGMARGLLGSESPILLRQNRKTALREADVIILAGSVADFRLDYGRALGRKAKIVAVNRSRSQLYLNSDMFWSPTVADEADPALFLTALASTLAGTDLKPRWADWLARLKSDEARTEAGNAGKGEEVATGHDDRAGQRLINPLKLLRALDASLPRNAILIGDGGDFVATAAYVVRPRGPLQWLDPGAFGTLGVGLGFAIGAALVHPDAEVWLLWGDGSVGYSVAEFDTCRRHGIAIHALVGNDAAWGQIERDQVPILGAATACTLAYTPYETVAEGYGGKGWVLEAHDADFAATFAAARRAAREGKGVPVLVNALIGKSDFREGSISV